MRCDVARQALSAAFDGEAVERPDELAAHRADCAHCRRFEADLESFRHQLRFELVADVPDVTPRVIAAVDSRRNGPRIPRAIASRRPWLAGAAAFVAGAVASATLLAGSRTGQSGVAAADIPERVVAAQQAVRSLSAGVTIVEHGWHAEVPEREFIGELQYAAPESMALTLDDRTTYPSPAWVANDVALVVDGATLWRKGPRSCPAESQPACTPPAPDITVVDHREPFADASPVPLELITPVESFALAGTPATLSDRRIAGRETIGVSVTAGQVGALLEGIRPAGNLREVHPVDTVELWLDRRTFVPLAFRVVVADRPERARWAAARGYQDIAGEVVLEFTLSDVQVNAETDRPDLPTPPLDARRVDAGFVDGPSAAPEPSSLPGNLVAHRAGRIVKAGPGVDVRTWTDGRAWLKVRSTTSWPGGRLFGELGTLVSPVDLGSAGTAYASEDGSRVAVHGDGIDVVVSGSLQPAELRAVAASLGVLGRSVPDDWQEAATATLDQARAMVDDLLAPAGLEGFGPPAVRVEPGEVSLAYAGAGDRGFLLVQLTDGTFTPPLDPDVQGVVVRGREGRYSPARGELEWGELDRVVSIRSTTMSLPELLAVAERLRPS